MSFTSTQRGPRSVVVNGEGNSWQYEFPIGSSEPVLQPGSPQWRDGPPDDAEQQTAAARMTAIVLAQQTGIIPNP